MENTINVTDTIINTINTILQNLFSSIDNNLYNILDDITFIDSDIIEKTAPDEYDFDLQDEMKTSDSERVIENSPVTVTLTNK